MRKVQIPRRQCSRDSKGWVFDRPVAPLELLWRDGRNKFLKRGLFHLFAEESRKKITQATTFCQDAQRKVAILFDAKYCIK